MYATVGHYDITRQGATTSFDAMSWCMLLWLANQNGWPSVGPANAFLAPASNSPALVRDAALLGKALARGLGSCDASQGAWRPDVGRVISGAFTQDITPQRWFRGVDRAVVVTAIALFNKVDTSGDTLSIAISA